MTLKKLAKKITAFLTAGALGVTLTFSVLPAPNAAALGLGDAIGVGIGIASTASQMNAIKKELDLIDKEGQAELYNMFREQEGVNDDPALNARFAAIMTNLTNAVAQVDTSINERPYRYFISADKSINAACGMAHVMMVNTGTFEHIATDDEIAAIVGHEIGHGQKDHVLKGKKQQLDKTVMAQVGAAIAGGSTLSNVAASLALKHSVAAGDKKQEWEADNLSWEYMQHTNYNLGAGAAVMQKFLELGGKSKYDFFNPSDHPDTEKRRDNYANKLYEYSGKHASARDGVVTVNGKTFMKVAAASSMSSAERAYFVVGNLAAAYHNKHNLAEAYVQNGTVMLGAQPIVTPADGDEDAHTLAERLNSIK